MLQPGDRAIVHGLNSRADLNGTAVNILQWHEASGRWAVRCASGEGVRIKSSNLLESGHGGLQAGVEPGASTDDPGSVPYHVITPNGLQRVSKQAAEARAAEAGKSIFDFSAFGPDAPAMQDQKRINIAAYTPELEALLASETTRAQDYHGGPDGNRLLSLAKSWGVDPGLVARAEEHYQRLKAQEANEARPRSGNMGRKERLLIEVHELLCDMHAETPRQSFDEACAEIRACATDPETGDLIGIDDGESDDIIDEAMQSLPEWDEDWPSDENYVEEGEDSDQDQ